MSNGGLNIVQLTDKEYAMIMAERAKAEKKKHEKAITIHLLQTTADYLEWLVENERGSSYSAFVDEFGYSGPFSYTNNHIYKVVSKIISNTRGLVWDSMDDANEPR